ncbi:hypothetical protein OBBRIDRAFT_724793 [Obba rivulosa]|uniref:Uncharacterized protein n=1 Tax=Obba rivulosa TaxID=1052685 RepID=A0A8E2J2V0_9APHY|nr:hypothetical protein OBBRIDRAFT_724793 [Obba rivulosa]
MHIVSTFFKLPLSSEKLSILSHGLISKGTVRITDSGLPGSEYMVIDIAMAYKYNHEFDNAIVCLLRPEGQYGVGIYTPERLHEERQYWTTFDIEVRLPTSPDNIPTFVKEFRTDMLSFSHEIGHLQNSVFSIRSYWTRRMRPLSLRSVHTMINVLIRMILHISQSLAAKRALLRTWQQQIRGSFVISSRLMLHAGNGAMDVDVKMLNAADGDATEIPISDPSMRYILMNLTTDLVSTSPNGTNGTFRINVHTTNVPLIVSTNSAPIDHILDLSASTVNGPAWVFLQPTWEGIFHLSTSDRSMPEVNADLTLPDPAGRGRERSVVVTNSNKGIMDGYAEWVPKGERRVGTVTISSANLLSLNL